MGQSDMTPGITADGNALHALNIQPIPLAGGLAGGKHEQNTVLHRFHTVIDSDKVAVAQLLAADIGIVVDQTVGAAHILNETSMVNVITVTMSIMCNIFWYAGGISNVDIKTDIVLIIIRAIIR
jgi:hypothetical protein